MLSFQLTEEEKKVQENAIQLESKTISHNIRQQIENSAEQVILLIKNWHSIQDINEHWYEDTLTIRKMNPFIEKVSLFPISELNGLTIPAKNLTHYQDPLDRKKQLKSHRHLPKTIDQLDKQLIYLSRAYYTHNEYTQFEIQIPLIISNSLVAYVEVSVNIAKLLNYKIDSFQIVKPFSISENGITLFSSLPTKMHINDVTKQFQLSIYNRDWQLMIWSKVTPRDKELFLIFSVLLSLLTALAIKLIAVYFIMQRKIDDADKNLKRIDEEFRSSKAKLIQSNKLTSLGEIATGIAHEINQPLQVICIHADMCQDSIEQGNYHLIDKSFKTIISQIDRIEKIVKQVGSFGRDSEQDNYKKEKPSEIFNNVIAIIINQYKQDKVELRQVIPPSLPNLYCNKTQIEQVLVNLLINAKDAVETSGQKVVFVKAHVKDNNLFIQISDTGTGIDPTKITDIFTPFYTTKPLGKGTGLGLSISYSMIHQHKGDIKVSSEIGKGSVFTVRLPLDSKN